MASVTQDPPHPAHIVGFFGMASNILTESPTGSDSSHLAAVQLLVDQPRPYHDPRFLRVYNRVEFPATYRNADVGFRIVVETK